MKNRFLIFSFIVVANPAIAFMCPTNFNQIDFGMTPDQVTQNCGKPDMKKDYEQANDNIPQEWSYFIPQTVSMGGSLTPAQGTLRTSMVFDDKGKAINISVNGIGVGTTTICAGSNINGTAVLGNSIQLGDDKATIERACGKPAMVTKQSQGVNPSIKESSKMTDFIYSSVSPPVTLVFQDGKLTERK